MAAASQKVFDEIRETLLTCKICEEPFDQQDRLPRVLPCHHAFCGPCLAKLNSGRQLSCPNCRQKIQVAGTFPVETTRSALLDCTKVIQTSQEAQCEGCNDGTKATSRCLDCAQTFCDGCCRCHQNIKVTKDHVLVSFEEAARSPSLLLQKVEMCQKHQDKKLEFYCKTCKSAICSTCVIILHKDRDGHDNVELSEMVEQAKRQIETHCESLNNILESILQPRAKTAATSLQETDASFKAFEKELEEAFSQAVNTLLDRKIQAMEELRSKWKAERMTMEDQAVFTQSMLSSAKTNMSLGRTVSSVGLPSHIVAQEQELERAVQEAWAEGEKLLRSPPSYKMNTEQSALRKCIQDLGTMKSDMKLLSGGKGLGMRNAKYGETWASHYAGQDGPAPRVAWQDQRKMNDRDMYYVKEAVTGASPQRTNTTGIQLMREVSRQQGLNDNLIWPIPEVRHIEEENE